MSTYEFTVFMHGLENILMPLIPLFGLAILGGIVHKFWKTWLLSRRDRMPDSLSSLEKRLSGIEEKISRLDSRGEQDSLVERIQVLEDIVTSDRYLERNSGNAQEHTENTERQEKDT